MYKLSRWNSRQEVVKARQIKVCLGPRNEPLQVRLVDRADGVLRWLVSVLLSYHTASLLLTYNIRTLDKH
jgi:hypothetical protein